VTLEGRQVWELVLRARNQLRVIQGAVVGFDFGAVFALASAMGVNRVALAEWLPGIEAVAAREMNRMMKEQSDV
jgi:hypothetical protein